MPVKVEPSGAVVVDFDAAIGEIGSDVQTAMDRAAQAARDRIRDAWYGIASGTPRDHADGSPTVSTGESGNAWYIKRSDFSRGQAVIEIANSVEYSQYVHPSGEGSPNHNTEGFGPNGDLGESGGRAYEQFEDQMKKFEDDIDQIVRDALADL
ncbi:MAG: hypothetical protein GY704_12010 [Phycisphaeraceae bacterium]|nr:hypothetical protein [Phycisphaeraceae bacterium]